MSKNAHGIVRAVLADLDVVARRPVDDPTMLEITVAGETVGASVRVPVDALDGCDRLGAALMVDELTDTAVEMLLEAAAESVLDR